MILLSPKQNEIARSRKRFRVINAGRRFGKTVLTVEEMIGVAVAKPDRRVAYIAPTFQQARDIAWEMLKNRVQPIVIDTNESQLKITIKTKGGGKSTITLKSWDAVESLRGQSFHFIVIDEVAMMRNFWSGWQEVIRPALTDTKGHAMFISTPKGFNHFYELYNMQDKDENFESFHATTYDNPHIDPDEIEQAKLQLPDDQFAQEYLADFRKVEGLVYKEFDRNRHVFTDQKNWSDMEKRGGIDFGHTNPAGILTVYRSKDRKYYVTDEYYERGKVQSELNQEMLSRRCESWYPDPAEPDRIEEMRRAGLSVNEVSKNVSAGIDTVRSLFKQNRLFIHLNCPNLIWEAETYRYKPKRADSNEPEEPIKENDHLCFSGDTVVNGKRIDTIGFPTGIKDIYEYDVAGTKIKATPEHPVLTQRGFVPIDTLRYDDVIWHNKLFTTVSNGTGLRPLLIGVTNLTILALKKLILARERDYIDMYGVKPTVKSPRAITYIILTTIQTIIPLATLLLFTLLNTVVTIWMKGVESGLVKTLKMLLRPPLNGQKRQRVKDSEKNLVKRTQSIFMTDHLLNLIANYVESHTRQKMSWSTSQDGVTTIANKRRYVGRETVWGLRTKSGMYRANGLMVSNCDALRYVLHMWENTTVSTVDDNRIWGEYALKDI